MNTAYSDNWLDLHIDDSAARLMTRERYYQARSWLRRVRHILRLRCISAKINPNNPNEIIIPATDDVMPEKFQ